ncbi:MAG: HAD family hydrolase [Alphaproteobacteria bacterium]|nr:HAD family hydrolase [Alphaproteobacteria bacterium]
MRPCVFLDRDGVLIEAILRNGRPYSASTPDEVKIIPGVREACARLKVMGFLLVMTTNQPDVARGKITRRFVDETNEMLAARLGLDAVQACLHDNADRCACRKPKPGLMLDAADRLGIDLASSYVVGDRWRDVEAAKNAGCKALLLDYGYDEAIQAEPDFVTGSLASAATWIWEQERKQ